MRRLNQRHFFSFFHSLPLTFKTRSVRPRVPGRAAPAPRARALTGRQVPGTRRPHAGRHATARGGHSGRGAVHCRFHLSFSVFFFPFYLNPSIARVVGFCLGAVLMCWVGSMNVRLHRRHHQLFKRSPQAVRGSGRAFRVLRVESYCLATILVTGQLLGRNRYIVHILP